jgi:broad specificity phosphatase PhoE
MAKTVIALCVVLLLIPAAAHGQKLVILTRHAERADGGPMSPKAQDDPPLSAAGEARATKLATMLRDSGIKAIFATEYRRTQDTAKPLASKLKLTVQNIPGDNTSELVARLKKEHAGDVVFVVGHSNTLPAIIKALGGPAVTIPDTEYDNLFVLVPGTGALTRLRFQPEG